MKVVKLSTIIKNRVWTTLSYPHFGGNPLFRGCINASIIVSFDKICKTSTRLFYFKKTKMWINVYNVENFRRVFAESFPQSFSSACNLVNFNKFYSFFPFMGKVLADVFKTNVYPHQGVL